MQAGDAVALVHRLNNRQIRMAMAVMMTMEATMVAMVGMITLMMVHLIRGVVGGGLNCRCVNTVLTSS